MTTANQRTALERTDCLYCVNVVNPFGGLYHTPEDSAVWTSGVLPGFLFVSLLARVGQNVGPFVGIIEDKQYDVSYDIPSNISWYDLRLMSY